MPPDPPASEPGRYSKSWTPAEPHADRAAWPDIAVFGPTLANPRELDRLAETERGYSSVVFAAAVREALNTELDRLLRPAPDARVDVRAKTDAGPPAPPAALPRPATRPRFSRRDWTLMIRSAAVGAAVAFTLFATVWVSGSKVGQGAPAPQVSTPTLTGLPPAAAATPVTFIPTDLAIRHLLADPEVNVVATAGVPEVEVFDALQGKVTHRLANPAETGGPLVFLVRDTADGWLRVDLPVRPNGSTGWVRTADVTLSTNTYRIEVSRGQRQFRLFRSGDVVMEAPVAIGAQDTPTPGGVFYIKELLQPPNPHTIYGPYAFGLSGYSNVLDEFNGGTGVIGIHGTDDPDAIGREVSHGCIRLSNEDIVKLVGVLPLGTPVAITE